MASYSDNNQVSIVDTTTGEEIWSGILNYGEAKVLTYEEGTDTYFTIKSSDTVTVCVQPWFGKTTSYSQGVYVMDKEGVGLGKEFIATSLNKGNLYALSYKDDTKVDIYNSSTGEFVNSYELKAGEYVDINPGNGLWLVKSNKEISMYSGYGTASAGFTPVQFGGMVREKNGTWNVIKESDTIDYNWSNISWVEKVPEGTSLTVKARVANTLEELENKEYVVVNNGIENEALKGKMIEILVEFATDNTMSPILEEIFIGEKEVKIPEVKVSNSIVTDKDVYKKDETLIITQKVSNDSKVDSINNLKVEAIMTNKEGKDVWSSENLIYELNFSSVKEIEEKLEAESIEAGKYTIKSYVYTNDDQLLSVDETEFEVVDEVLVVDDNKSDNVNTNNNTTTNSNTMNKTSNTKTGDINKAMLSVIGVIFGLGIIVAVSIKREKRI